MIKTMRRLVLLAVLSVVAFPTTGQSKDSALVISLDEALKIALSENVAVKVADKEIERSEYAKKGTYSSLFPQVSGSGSYQRTIKKQIMYMDSDSGDDEEGGGFGMLSSLAPYFMRINELSVLQGMPPIIPGESETSSSNSGFAVGRWNTYNYGVSAQMPLVNAQLWESLKISGQAVDLAVEKARSSREGGSLILMSHLGRPKGVTEKFSLKHIVAHVSECLGVPVQFADDCQKADAQAAALKPGEVLMLENLRFYAEEEGKPRGLAEDATDEEKAAAKKAVKESQKEFVKKLASYADCYINDAFGTAHRAHASTALIAAYFPEDKMFGYLMEKEIKAIDNVLKNARRPFTAIIGGSKVSSKLAVLENLLGKVDNLIICGGRYG